jgi:hypothetical protein
MVTDGVVRSSRCSNVGRKHGLRFGGELPWRLPREKYLFSRLRQRDAEIMVSLLERNGKKATMPPRINGGERDKVGFPRNPAHVASYTRGEATK